MLNDSMSEERYQLKCSERETRYAEALLLAVQMHLDAEGIDVSDVIDDAAKKFNDSNPEIE